mmetsp:Transcript_40722/g.128118  ORF Transcript_40722/g.128118 Transcript_40722/m.128118 type:complete len:209 (+) Transcript_40722:3-629(+)
MIQGVKKIGGGKDQPEPPGQHRTSRDMGAGVLGALIIYVLFLLLGAGYYGLVDNCVCPGLQECEMSGSSCEESGGQTRDLSGGFYMAAITLTTVGFGDELPTYRGRLFGIFWMLFGVAAMANFLAELAHLTLLEKMKYVSDHGMSHELFMKIDQDGSSTLNKFEFVTYMLVKYGLVSEADLDLLLSEFENFDKDESGELTYEEIRAAA